MKRKLFFIAWLLCFSLAAPATEYYITEAQLQTLEAVCQNYKKTNLTLQKQVEGLQQRVTILQTESQNLNKQLEQERQTTQTLNQSLSQYERNSSQSEAEKVTLLQEIAQLKFKVQKYQIACVTLTATIIILILAATALAFIKLKY